MDARLGKRNAVGFRVLLSTSKHSPPVTLMSSCKVDRGATIVRFADGKRKMPRVCMTTPQLGRWAQSRPIDSQCEALPSQLLWLVRIENSKLPNEG